MQVCFWNYTCSSLGRLACYACRTHWFCSSGTFVELALRLISFYIISVSSFLILLHCFLHLISRDCIAFRYLFVSQSSTHIWWGQFFSSLGFINSTECHFGSFKVFNLVHHIVESTWTVVFYYLKLIHKTSLVALAFGQWALGHKCYPFQLVYSPLVVSKSKFFGYLCHHWH